MKKREITKRVYFVRHGQSEGNVAPGFQSFDSPLTKKGKEQARYIAERATHLPIDVIIASPLSRAKEKAREVVEKIEVLISTI